MYDTKIFTRIYNKDLSNFINNIFVDGLLVLIIKIFNLQKLMLTSSIRPNIKIFQSTR